MYFVCGVHGVGKTTYCQFLRQKLGIPYYSASKLIEKNIKLNQRRTKKIDRIIERQFALINEVKNLEKEHENFILDGHLCLINKEGIIERISKEVFKALNIQEICCLKADEMDILQRIQKRDNIDWDLTFVENFQKEEMEYAIELSAMLDIKLNIVDTSQRNNIVLPISPVYTNKILDGKKKYEYRKKLCKKDIKKIYIYATSPIKLIIGEVDVLSKISMEKNQLWELTAGESGVSHEFFLDYFERQIDASAYKIDNAKRYKQGIPLKDIGLTFALQSYVYVGEI